jgi:chromosome segregation ATPase
VQQQRSKNESVDLQNQVSELQTQLETLQRTYKKRQDELEASIGHKSSTTKEIGQVRMACQNLYDRCQAVNQQYRGRAGRDDNEDDMLAQLQVIGDCLDDYMCIITEWKKKKPTRADEAGAAPGAATAATRR